MHLEISVLEFAMRGMQLLALFRICQVVIVEIWDSQYLIIGILTNFMKSQDMVENGI